MRKLRYSDNQVISFLKVVVARVGLPVVPLLCNRIKWRGSKFNIKPTLTRTLLALCVVFPVFAKRPAPADVSPICSGDYIYTVPHWSIDNGTNQNGGFVQVLDAKTGAVVWGVQVYKTKYKPKLERDVQDVFITELYLNTENSVLTVKDELGRTYEINLKTHKVQAIE